MPALLFSPGLLAPYPIPSRRSPLPPLNVPSSAEGRVERGVGYFDRRVVVGVSGLVPVSMGLLVSVLTTQYTPLGLTEREHCQQG